MEDQKPNLVILSIYQDGFPAIKMVTEAGIIGKIGLNSCGVGVCLNAIKAKGLEASHLPVHLGLRMVLECRSAAEAIHALECAGMASSAHMLIADSTAGGTGLEFTATSFAQLPANLHGRVYHSNHFLEKSLARDLVPDRAELANSEFRLHRIETLTEKVDAKGRDPSWSEFSQLFDDHDQYPCSICRAQEGPSNDASLFNIVMDLQEKRAVVRLGRPCLVEESVELVFPGE